MIGDQAQIVGDGYFRFDCAQCGRELLFTRLMGDHPGDAVRAFCSEACLILWQADQPSPGAADVQ